MDGDICDVFRIKWPILPIIPASLFSIVLGLAGLGNAWRVARRIWGFPTAIGESLMVVATLVWAILLILYVCKWLLARESAFEELRHPVDASFIGLVGVATMLIANACLPYSRELALGIFWSGATFTAIFAVWQTGALWQNNRHYASTTAALYLPTVAGSFVTGTIAASLGLLDWARLAFGAGVFSWLAIESVLAHRLYTMDTLPIAQRPSLGIQFAPPAVGGVTYMAITIGPPDLFSQAIVGYGVLQALVILRLALWIGTQPISPSYWAFTFGSASLATTLMKMVERGEHGAVSMLAPICFIGANVVVFFVALGTAKLVWGQWCHSTSANP